MVSVKDYLEQKGYTWKKVGDKWVTNSPYKPGGDSSPSFVLYPSGVFKCYATGKSGNAITLARELFDNEKIQAKEWIPTPTKPKKPLPGYIPTKYTTLTQQELDAVKAYADKRKIHVGYFPAIWVMQDKRWPALGFEHVDNNFSLIGAKLRLIEGQKGDRMRTIGSVGFYILDARVEGLPPTTYLIESETSANSLWEYLRQQRISAVVVSSGSVGTVPKSLPFDYPLKKIIDFDGDEVLWKKRIERYNHLGGTNVKLKLEKGADINSLWQTGELWRIDYLL